MVFKTCNYLCMEIVETGLKYVFTGQFDTYNEQLTADCVEILALYHRKIHTKYYIVFPSDAFISHSLH